MDVLTSWFCTQWTEEGNIQRCKNVWTHEQCLCKTVTSLGKIHAKFYAVLLWKGVISQFCAVQVIPMTVNLCYVYLSLLKRSKKKFIHIIVASICRKSPKTQPLLPLIVVLKVIFLETACESVLFCSLLPHSPSSLKLMLFCHIFTFVTIYAFLFGKIILPPTLFV